MGPGAQLAGEFFAREVRAIVERTSPGLRYAAARLGSGSDVLGFDDARSMDHDFGCRLTLLVDDDDADQVPVIDEALERELPDAFSGRPIRFPTSWDTRVHHQVEVATVRAFAQSRLGVDALDDLEPVDWLCLTGQSVLEVVGGPIFQDTTRQYRGVTERLSWYPNDVWLYVLAASWARLGQELPFVGRIGERGDEVGSRIVAERLARDLVHLAFLLERRWAPYPKWAGLALRALPTAPMLTEHLEAAGGATDWKHLERELCAAIDVLGRRQAELGLPVVEPFFEQFFDRPFQIANPAMPATLLAAATDPVVRRLPLGIGSIEQWCDNVDVLSQPTRRAAARELYRQLVNDKH